GGLNRRCKYDEQKTQKSDRDERFDEKTRIQDEGCGETQFLHKSTSVIEWIEFYLSSCREAAR
ncbi:hypothetical protein RZS08_40775, partial [Arthrospira platensis SPKY1]|nr:hypothetical protein [Arthrospira platensis SPKY1]